jgi:heterodisulfide reductase subunit D
LQSGENALTIFELFIKEKQLFLDNCTQCGLCAEECPILPFTDFSEISSQEIQKGVFEYIESGMPNQGAYTKAFACMECFKCTTDVCPEDLNPMLINEIIKGEYISKGLAPSTFSDSGKADSAHRILAGVQASEDDYKRILIPSDKQKAEYVFFPGCNVYYQPEKILNALDILDAIGDDYAFLPGLEHCCGDNHLFYGDVRKGSTKSNNFLDAVLKYQPKAVLLWCPTCLCRFDKYISPSNAIPFEVLSFPKYLSENMNRLSLTDSSSVTVTLHEACKSAYTGLDLYGPRDVLQRLPGVKLIEMEHCGSDTICCGSGAACWFPDSCGQIRDSRLQEAAETGAQILATVCHYCGQTFVDQEAHYNFSVTNYVNLVAKAMGIHREDKFRQYKLWGDIDLIIEDAGKRIAELPYGGKRVIEVLEAVFKK